jgi:flagellar hook-associated protein 1 FlgK
VLIEDTTQLTTSDYEVEFTSATNYTVRRVSDGTNFGPFDITVVPAAEFDGVSVNIASGTFAAGDRFRIMPTRNAGEYIRADMTRPEELAFAAPLKAQTSPANIGTGVISQPTLTTEINIYDPAAQADLETSLRNAPPLRIVMGAAGGATQAYDVVDINGNVIDTGVIVPGQNNKLTVNVPVSAGPPAVPVAFDYEVTISGRPQSGDNFSVGFNTNGVSDNRNALKLVDLQKRTTIGINPLAPATTGSSFTDAYGDLVERVGTLTSQARVDGEATGAILKQAADNRDSVSAVNLDEEAAKLIQFEQYYQASAQIIQVARNLFDTLINTF